MKDKILLTIVFGLFFGIFLISFTSAVCTVNFEKDSYSPTETVTADMVCSGNTERSQDYTLNWTLNGVQQLELDIGTTPDTKSEHFYETYELNSTYVGTINVTLTGTNLEGVNGANVTGAASNQLLMNNFTIGDTWLGLTTSLESRIRDENGKKITGGLCEIHVMDNSDTEILEDIADIPFDGEVGAIWSLYHGSFEESTDYILELSCKCGASGSETECQDEDGVSVTNSVGTAEFPYTTNTWITFNQDPFPIVYANGSNFSNAVVSSGIDKINWRRNASNNFDEELKSTVKTFLVNNDTGRIYGIPNEGSTAIGERTFGIGNESINFDHLINKDTPSGVYFIRLFFEVYHGGFLMMEYIKETEEFNVTNSNLVKIGENVFLEETKWSKVSNTQYNVTFDIPTLQSPKNLTSVSIVLPNDILDQSTPLERIKNFTLTYANGSSVSLGSSLAVQLFYDEDSLFNKEASRSVILIENVNLTKSDNNFTINLNTYNFAARSTSALEGIENKTGTFHLAIDCPQYGYKKDEIDCLITAQIEDPQQVQKEVDFTCYITDGTSKFSTLNFNQMITRLPISMTKSFAIPNSLSSGSEYVVQCHADYYNLGSRRDSFFDNFMAADKGSGFFGEGAPITGGIVDEEEREIDEEGPIDFGKSYFWIILLIVLGIIIYLAIKKKEREIYYQNKRLNVAKRIVELVMLLLIVIGVIVSLIYGYSLIHSILPGPSIVSSGNIESVGTGGGTGLFQDSLFRLLILLGFIALLIVIVFRSLNVRGEVRFGGNSRADHNGGISRLQDKINKEILKGELKREKSQVNYRVRRIP